MNDDYTWDWWNTSLRCHKCDTKIHFKEDIKPLVEDWKIRDLPKKLLIECTFQGCKTKIEYDIFIDVERRLE